MPRPAGSALATVLMAISLMMLLAFALAATGTFELQLTTSVNHTTSVRDEEERVVTQAIDQLSANPTAQPDETTADGSTALTFSPQTAVAHGLQCSVNNLANASATPGPQGSSVPPNAAWLSTTRPDGSGSLTTDVVVTMGAWHYALAATCPIQSRGGVTVGGLPPGGSPSTASLLPASIASDAGGAQAIQLGPQTTILGNVTALGGVQVQQPSMVDGEVQAYWTDPIPIPNLALDQVLDPAMATPISIAPTVVNGFMQSSTSLTVPGSLTLQNGILLVTGDLTVNGGIQGVGAIFVSGSLTVNQGSTMTSDEQAALVCGGDLNLAGSSMDKSSITGIVYTQGNLNAHDVTVVGTVIANSPQSDQVTLRNVALQQSDASSTLAFPLQLQSQQSIIQSLLLQNTPSSVSGDIQLVDLSHQDQNLGGNLFRPDFNGMQYFDPNPPHEPITLQQENAMPHDSAWQAPDGTMYMMGVNLGSTSPAQLMDPKTGLLRTDWTAQSTTQQLSLGYGMSHGNWSGTQTLGGLPPNSYVGTFSASSVDQFNSTLQSTANSLFPPPSTANGDMVTHFQNVLPTAQANFAVALNLAAARINPILQTLRTSTSTTTSTSTYNYRLDPNSFLLPRDRVRILMWRQR